MQPVSLQCTICFDLANNALECSNKGCRKLICEHCYKKVSALKSVTAACPFCRQQPFTVNKSPQRETINAILLKCKQCSNNIPLVKFDYHAYECQAKPITCIICKVPIPRGNIVMHTWEKHKDNIGNIIMKYQQGSEFIKPETILYRNHERIAALKKEVQIGVTGKFYCGGKLETPCKCCDGTCGPTNGENCVECMRLDQQKRNLQKGHLVNSSGRPCWPQGKKYVCGIMTKNRDHCRPDNQCNECEKLTMNKQRYKEL